jgi:hypothetical protein
VAEQPGGAMIFKRRLVHHATILEMNVESYRRRAALQRGTADMERFSAPTDL